jgi:hypothetical protein
LARRRASLKGRRAIYENTLLAFEGNPHAHWFTGSITCEAIDILAREYDDVEADGAEHTRLNPMPIILRSRDGLEHEHPFYKALTSVVEPLLAELVREEERNAKEGEVRESARLRRALDSLGRDLGQLVDADLREIDEDGLGGGPGGASSESEQLRLIPESPVLYMVKTRPSRLSRSGRLGRSLWKLRSIPKA